MNYESIAKMVHKCVKNPNNMLARENGLAESEIKAQELSIIQIVFSKYEVSGDIISAKISPLSYWG